MKPARFKYVRARSVDEALAVLAEHGGDAKVIAGGQSLVPMLNFRLLAPAALVDIGRITELAYVRDTRSGGFEVGALTRHRTLETSPRVLGSYPVLGAAVAHIGHLAIRNRGTLGGSLAHADPTAELPLMSVLLDARITATSPRGMRTIDAKDFFVGPLSTVLEGDEILTGVELPAPGGLTGWAFEEFARRSGDYAIAAVGVLMRASGGRIADARIAVAGGGGGPVRVAAAEATLAGSAFDESAAEAAARAVDSELEPTGDLQVSADYRRHLIGVLLRRALRTAWQRAHRA